MAKKKVISMENIWFVLTLFTFGIFVYSTIIQGFKSSYILLIGSILCFLMFLWRRSMRQKE